MYERVDIDKVANGLATCLNMLVTPQGPVIRRLGTAFVAAIKNGTAYAKLIEFNFSQTQNFVIVASAGNFRFYADGAVLLAGTLPTWAIVTAYHVGDAVVAGGVNYYCILANTGLAPIANPLNWYAMPGTGEYEIPNPYNQSDLSTLHYVQSGDVITLVHPNYPPQELQRLGNTQWVLAPIAFSSAFTPPTAVTAVATAPHASVTETFKYQVTTVDSLGVQESLPSTASGAVTNDLTVTGDYNTITWTAATVPSGQTIGAYNVYKSINGGAFGYAGQVPYGVNTFTDNNITPDMGQTPPQNTTIFNSAGNYPGAVCYYEQRKFFGGTINQPSNCWATQSGTENNMDYSIPSQASDALRFGIYARGQNQILHLVQSLDLIAFTASNEFRIYTASGDALTPSSLAIKSQAQNGAANVMPITSNNFVVYPQYNGGRLRELSFDWTIQGYKSADLCLLAQHLFDGETIVDMAYTHTPNPIVWAINSAGVLLGLTYVPDQDIRAWHQHVTDGVFESCCSIPENGADRLYVIVKRTVNGNTVRYLEYIDPPLVVNLMNAFYVDAGASFTSSTGPVSSIAGLNWLEGETVAILADGYVMSQQVVTGGVVNLDFAATLVQVGLPFTAQLITPPPIIQGDADMGQSRVKDVNDIWVRVVDSGAFMAGPYTGNAAVDVPNLVQVTTGVFAPSAPTPLVSDILQVAITSSLNESSQVMVLMSDPLPLTVVGMTLEVAVGG